MFLTKRYPQRHIRVDSENVQLLPHYLRLFLVLKLCQVVIISCEGKRKAWEGKHERGPAETHTPSTITDFSSVTGAQGLTLYSNFLSLIFPGGSVEKNPPASAGDTVLNLGLGRSPGEGNSNPVFLCRKTHGQSSLVGYSPRGHKTHKKSQTQLSD